MKPWAAGLLVFLSLTIYGQDDHTKGQQEVKPTTMSTKGPLSGPKGLVTGVISQHGAPLPGVELELFCRVSNYRDHATTDEKGAYHFDEVLITAYTYQVIVMDVNDNQHPSPPFKVERPLVIENIDVDAITQQTSRAPGEKVAYVRDRNAPAQTR